MTDRGDRRESEAVDPVDLVVLSGADGARGLGLEFERAAMVGSDLGADIPRPTAQTGRLYLELTSSTGADEVAAAFARAEQLGPRWSLVVGLTDGTALSPEVRAEFDAVRGWRVVDVLSSDELIALELAVDRDADGDRDGGSDGDVGLGTLVDVARRAAAAGDVWRARAHELERDRDAQAAVATRRQEALERLRAEVTDLNHRLIGERRALQRTRAELENARAALAAARQRITRIEGSRAMRLTRGYWRLRTTVGRRKGSTGSAPNASSGG